MPATPFEEGLASLRAHYVRRIDAAVAVGRMDLVRELANDYEDEALQLMIAVEGGVVCLVPWEGGKRQERTAKLTRRIAEELGRAFEEAPIVVAGNRCEGLADYPAAWERCGRMIRIGRSFGLTGALSSQDFGPLPMLVAASASADSFAMRFFGGIGIAIAFVNSLWLLLSIRRAHR